MIHFVTQSGKLAYYIPVEGEVGHWENVHTIDIAYGLARIQRFAGQVPDDKWISVAEHSVGVSYLVETHDPRHKLAALLHDATEAYIGDHSGPFGKLAGDQYHNLRADMERALCYRYSCATYSHSAEIKAADMLALAIEKHSIPAWRNQQWPAILPTPSQTHFTSYEPMFLPPDKAQDLFMRRFANLISTSVTPVSP